MHSKTKGMRGEFAVSKYLADNNYPVFKELGDLSKIDLITEVDGKLIKIQVKAITEKENKIEVHPRKSGPGYEFHYTEEMVDIFAAYILNKDVLFFVSSKEICSNRSSVTFSLQEPKGKNQHKARMVSDYLDFKKALI